MEGQQPDFHDGQKSLCVHKDFALHENSRLEGSRLQQGRYFVGLSRTERRCLTPGITVKLSQMYAAYFEQISLQHMSTSIRREVNQGQEYYSVPQHHTTLHSVLEKNLLQHMGSSIRREMPQGQRSYIVPQHCNGYRSAEPPLTTCTSTTAIGWCYTRELPSLGQVNDLYQVLAPSFLQYLEVPFRTIF